MPDLFTDAPGPVGARSNVAVGSCSWTEPTLIQCGRFYPKGCSSAEQRLRHYADQFCTVEVDSAYFALPSAANSALWVERTPPGFEFTIKAFRLFTGHQTPAVAFPKDIAALLPPLTGRSKNYYYADVPAEIRAELWRRYIEAVMPLQNAGKLLGVLFQFAPWLARSAKSRAHVEECVARMAGLHVAVEFRNQSWAADAGETLAWERELGVTHVVVDEPQGVGNFMPAIWEAASDRLAIVRLHGRNLETWDSKSESAADRFDYEYCDQELQALAMQAETLAARVFRLQLVLNVCTEDKGIVAARRLSSILSKSS
jgi:uncharacterized protein YecE (DUF72 family)